MRTVVFPINVLLIEGQAEVDIRFKHPVYNEDTLVTCKSRKHNYCTLWDLTGIFKYSLSKVKISVSIKNLGYSMPIQLTLEGKRKFFYTVQKNFKQVYNIGNADQIDLNYLVDGKLLTSVPNPKNILILVNPTSNFLSQDDDQIFESFIISSYKEPNYLNQGNLQSSSVDIGDNQSKKQPKKYQMSMKKQSKRVRMKSLGSGTYYKLTKKDSNWLCNEKNACDIKLRVQTKG